MQDSPLPPDLEGSGHTIPRRQMHSHIRSQPVALPLLPSSPSPLPPLPHLTTLDPRKRNALRDLKGYLAKLDASSKADLLHTALNGTPCHYNRQKQRPQPWTGPGRGLDTDEDMLIVQESKNGDDQNATQLHSFKRGSVSPQPERSLRAARPPSKTPNSIATSPIAASAIAVFPDSAPESVLGSADTRSSPDRALSSPSALSSQSVTPGTADHVSVGPLTTGKICPSCSTLRRNHSTDSACSVTSFAHLSLSPPPERACVSCPRPLSDTPGTTPFLSGTKRLGGRWLEVEASHENEELDPSSINFTQRCFLLYMESPAAGSHHGNFQNHARRTMAVISEENFDTVSKTPLQELIKHENSKKYPAEIWKRLRQVPASTPFFFVKIELNLKTLTQPPIHAHSTFNNLSVFETSTLRTISCITSVYSFSAKVLETTQLVSAANAENRYFYMFEFVNKFLESFCKGVVHELGEAERELAVNNLVVLQVFEDVDVKYENWPVMAVIYEFSIGYGDAYLYQFR